VDRDVEVIQRAERGRNRWRAVERLEVSARDRGGAEEGDRDEGRACSEDKLLHVMPNGT
jgi:hypothetical protein